jgi:hypothetical protein
MLANTRDEATQQIETLDREIAGAEGHGAEAEMWLAQVRNAQPLQPSQQNDVS